MECVKRKQRVLLTKGLVSERITSRQGSPCFGLFQYVPVGGEKYEEQDFGKELKIHNGLLVQVEQANGKN